MRHLLFWLERKRCRLVAWVDGVLGYRDLRRQYREAFFRDPDLVNPMGFSEKIQWRKLNDRNPLFPLITDKLCCRDFVSDRLGPERAGELLPALIWSGSEADAIPFERLKQGAVLKANHGSSWNVVLAPGAPINEHGIRQKCELWLNSVFGVTMHEWAYSEIPPRLIAEELLAREGGRKIADLKAYVFDGKIALFHYIDNETGLRGLFLPDWQKAKATVHLVHGEADCDIGLMPRPPYLGALTEVAEKLCAGFDMIRMDFLVSDTRFWIGEMTLYPASGYGFFAPEAFEQEMGAKWRLPSENKG